MHHYTDNMNMAELCIKRGFDLIASLIGILLCFLPACIIALLIKREDGDAVIYKQERVGKGGKPFMMYKFRTMKADSEGDTPQLSQEDDSRLTRIGCWLRDHHIDELPQLYNILIGDMSIVGYRPERPYFVRQIMAINDDYAALYCMRPGIFSPATLYNGYTYTMDKMLERLRLDLQYLTTRTLWLDCKIIALTMASILSGKKF